MEASSPLEAVEVAVRANLPCMLGPAIRVSLSNERSPHPFDVYYEAPYEEFLPELFDGTLDVQVLPLDEIRARLGD